VRRSLVAALRRDGQLRARDVEMHTRTGEVRNVLLNLERIDLDGAPHLLVTAIDVTERRAAERAVRERDERFLQLAASIREVFYLYDCEQDRVLYCSPAYEAIWGRSVEDLQRSPADWLRGVHPDDRPRLDALFRRRATTPFEDRYRIVRPDGAVRWIEDHVFPIVDGSGRVVRFAGVADDVTERRQLEEQLHQSQKMESIGLLAGGVAHDFNNVLTIVLTCAEMLRRGADAESRELVDDILSAVTRASSLTRQLLVFSRREVVEPRVLDLNAAVVDAEKMLRRLIGEDVVLDTGLAPVLGRVRIDPGQLLQTLMNLVVNARDAMPRGGRLTITTRDVGVEERVTTLLGTLPPARYAMLAVTDTGCGMTPEVQARVFEPFFTTKAAGHGTGMGLAVAHGIVRQAGGLIDLHSRPGAGTTFAIYLPCVEEAAHDPSGEIAAVASRGHDTVLVVEDADDVRRVTARVLEARGYHVLQASRGGDGLALLERHPEVRLLITDVVMPGMDGRELAQAAARLRPALRILYTSGYTDDAVQRHGIRAAEVAFLSKPFTPDVLVRKVHDVLGVPRGDRW
jgi:PAS domain S-box-containing protein